MQSARALQLGPDLLLRIRFGSGASPTWRVRAGFDSARGLHRTTLEFENGDPEGAHAARLREALASAQRAVVAGCALVFDETLRGALPQARLARALAPSDDLSRGLVRSALRRLGALSPEGRVTLVDGTRLGTAEFLELEVARHQAHQVLGLLSLLRHVVGELEPDRDAALRGLVAPESEAGKFGAALQSASDAEATCLNR